MVIVVGLGKITVCVCARTDVRTDDGATVVYHKPKIKQTNRGITIATTTIDANRFVLYPHSRTHTHSRTRIAHRVAQFTQNKKKTENHGEREQICKCLSSELSTKQTNNSPKKKSQILYLKPSAETKERERDRNATKARATGANETDDSDSEEK